MAGRGFGYHDSFGYGFNAVTEHSPRSQVRRGSSTSSRANVSPNVQPEQNSANSSHLNIGLSSRVSSVSDLTDSPAPLLESYLGEYPPSQRRQSRHADGYAVSPQSRPASQFEAFQPTMPSTTNGYTVSPPSRPVSQFEPFQPAFQPAHLRATSGNRTSPSSQPTSQFRQSRPQPSRRYSSGRYSAGTPDLEEVDITHTHITQETESPMEDFYAFCPPQISHSPSTESSSNTTPGSQSTGSWSLMSPLNGYQPVGTAAPPPTPTSPSSVRRMSQKLKSIRMSRKISVHPTINEDGEGVELLEAASLPGGKYDGKLDDDQPLRDRTDSVVDLSSYLGPQTRFDEQTTKKYNALEASGHLTGGLGSDVVPETLTTGQLMASSPVDLNRKLTRMGTHMGHKSTVRNLAQREADKRGIPIAYIAEEDEDKVGIDIGDGFIPEFQGGGIQRAHALRTELVYPTANWKPFTMRWPYLTFLILVSAALGGCQEYLYQKSTDNDGILQFTDPGEMDLWDFFTSKYLGAIVTVAYGVLWQLTDIEVKRLEPYYQLGKKNGALAAQSINIDYTTLFDVFRPFTAFWYRHWAVAISSVASVLAVIVIPVLQSASQDLDPKRAGPGTQRNIVFESAWSRALSLTLFGVSLLGLVLLVLLQSRTSGLTTDVKGIAGVVAMATKSHILMDFKDLDTAPPKKIHETLKLHRYALRNSSLAPLDTKRNIIKMSSGEKKTYDMFKLDNNPHPFMMRLKSCFFLQGFLVFFLLLIPVLLFTPASVVSERLPWLTTAIAVGLKFAMQTLEQDMRMMEPFWVLHKRHAPPTTLTLDYAGMAFGYMPIRALLNGHLLLASLGIGSILLEILTVCVSSLGTVSGNAFVAEYVLETLGRGQETPLSFWLSLGIFVVIMLYLIGTTALVMHYRRKPFLPRQPSTIASVLAFVHQSKMLWDFADSNAEGTKAGITVIESNDKMVQRLQQQGRTYGYGWFMGRDDLIHCGVEEEEVKDYIFGKEYDHRAATIRPGENYWTY